MEIFGKCFDGNGDNVLKKVDVIIPVYKPGDEFKNTLKRLVKQTVAINKLILIQTVPDDFAGEILKVNFDVDFDEDSKSNKNFHVPELVIHAVNQSEFDHGKTRNFGASYSDADYILFMTQDAIPADKHLIENLLKTFDGASDGDSSDAGFDGTSEGAASDAGFDGASDGDSSSRINGSGKVINAISYARQLPRKEADIVEELTRLHNYPKESRVKTAADLENMGIKTYFCSDVCAMYDKKIFDELDGFVYPTIFNEDMIMASKVMDEGYSVTYAADAKVIHSHSYTCMQQLRRNFDLGISQKMYSEVFDRVSSEKEGAGYAKKVVFTLLKKGLVFKAFYFCMQCGFKLVGYKLGKNYDRLPKPLILSLTSNKSFFGK